MRPLMPRKSALMSQADYDSTRLSMDRLPLKLQRARDKYFRYLGDIQRFNMDNHLIEIDKQVLELLNQEKKDDGLSIDPS